MASRSEPVAAKSDQRAAAVDFRLARNAVIADYRAKRVTREDVCDAHPELLRAAKAGTRANEQCPICEVNDLVHVTYARRLADAPEAVKGLSFKSKELETSSVVLAQFVYRDLNGLEVSDEMRHTAWMLGAD